MAYIRMADAGAGIRNIPVVLQDLSYHANNYSLIRFYCDDGQTITVTGGGGSVYTGFYSNVANFYGLRPDTEYGFRVETIYGGGTRWTPARWEYTYFRTLPDPTPSPATRPSISLHSKSGNKITWSITAGSNTDTIYIDRTWSVVTSTKVRSGENFTWSYDAPRDGLYGIRAYGSGPGGSSSYTDWNNQTIAVYPTAIGMSITNRGRQSFRVNISGGARSSTFAVEVREGNSRGPIVWSSHGNPARTEYLTVEGLKEGTNYHLTAWGYNSYGNGPSSTTTTSTLNPIVVGNVTNLHKTEVSTTSFRLNWDAATNATRYQVRLRKRDATSWLVDANTDRRYYNFANLTPNTYYEMQVRGYQDSYYGDWTSVYEVRTEAEKPTPLKWPTFASGNNFTLEAEQWNNLASKINAWRTYRGWVRRTITTAVKDNELKATMFNEMIDYLNELSTPTPPPTTKVSRGDNVTADRINGLGNAIDSLQ